ncbi:MAG: hypothetical protein SFT91_01210 [Rickettsiaceae bacterium]|nr:hypothetical protein [Rickettsiaceae bacterium]
MSGIIDVEKAKKAFLMSQIEDLSHSVAKSMKFKDFVLSNAKAMKFLHSQNRVTEGMWVEFLNKIIKAANDDGSNPTESFSPQGNKGEQEGVMKKEISFPEAHKVRTENQKKLEIDLEAEKRKANPMAEVLKLNFQLATIKTAPESHVSQYKSQDKITEKQK